MFVGILSCGAPEFAHGGDRIVGRGDGRADDDPQVRPITESWQIGRRQTPSER